MDGTGDRKKIENGGREHKSVISDDGNCEGGVAEKDNSNGKQSITCKAH
jgi:hypothetical protein